MPKNAGRTLYDKTTIQFITGITDVNGCWVNQFRFLKELSRNKGNKFTKFFSFVAFFSLHKVGSNLKNHHQYFIEKFEEEKVNLLLICVQSIS